MYVYEKDDFDSKCTISACHVYDRGITFTKVNVALGSKNPEGTWIDILEIILAGRREDEIKAQLDKCYGMFDARQYIRTLQGMKTSIVRLGRSLEEYLHAEGV